MVPPCGEDSCIITWLVRTTYIGMYTVGIDDTQLLGSQLEVGTMDLEQEPTILSQGMMCIHLKIELINDKNW